jgi:hypothetical protein
MITQILFSLKPIAMGNCKWLVLGVIICAFWSCKKTETTDPEIIIENLYVESIDSNLVSISYKLSHLGYQETGVSYYKKSNPTAVKVVNAIREDDRLKLSLQSLEPNTEYVFKVFYKQNDEQKINGKEYNVKTLSTELAKYNLIIREANIECDVDGNFSVDIEGDNLVNLNLSELDIKVNLNRVTVGYPVKLQDNKYKINIKGKVNAVNQNYAIQGYYKGREIFFQTANFVFGGEGYWLTYQPTSLPGIFYPSVLNNEIYSFSQDQIFKWNAADQRLSVIANLQRGTAYLGGAGIQFNGQLFFPATGNSHLSENDPSVINNYPEGYSYLPATDKWTAYPFKVHSTVKNRYVLNSNYFIHKNELYLVYSLADDAGGYPAVPKRADNFIYHYNKLTKQFEEKAKLDTEIINYHFISLNNQLYLLGLVPVFDQGFKVSATFAVFKVDDNFKSNEVYRGGTVKNPLTFFPKNVVAYDQKILISVAVDDFKLFDPAEMKLYQVGLRNGIDRVYLGAFFDYNNKLHFTADGYAYEFSIVKGR